MGSSSVSMVNVRPASVAFPARLNHGNDDDDDDDVDASMTLEEFLQECDKSPKSRVS